MKSVLASSTVNGGDASLLWEFSFDVAQVSSGGVRRIITPPPRTAGITLAKSLAEKLHLKSSTR